MDQMIVELFLNRSETAITELSKQYGKLCKSVAMNILNNEQDAEECVNDAYLATWNQIPPERPNPMSSYICKITRNLSLKRYHFNIASKRNHHYDAVLDEVEECFLASGNVEDEVLIKELSSKLNLFLATCKEKDRVMFVKRYWFGESIEQIAKEMDESGNNVTVRLHRTREKCRKCLMVEGLI